MKIQISPKRIVADAVVVWNEQTPDVDIVMPVDKLSFAPGSIEELYAFHVLEHLFPSEIPKALENWRSIMAPGKDIYIVADDFEVLCRSFIGAEIDIDRFNNEFSYPTRLTRDNLILYLKGAGYADGDMKLWFVDVPNLFKKSDLEIIIAAKKA